MWILGRRMARIPPGGKIRGIRYESTNEVPRVNPVGIQHLSIKLHNKVFPAYKVKNSDKQQESNDVIELSKRHLSNNDLLGKKTVITTPISFDIPNLEGNSLDEHFYKLGKFTSEPYLSMAIDLSSSSLPPIPEPEAWVFESGWHRYTADGRVEKVEYPLEHALVFDVETMYKISNYSVLAACASTEAWYGWVSPYLTSDGKEPMEQLIPMNCLHENKLIVGHNVGYDRARIEEEYNMEQSKAFYLDTMSLHIAVSGMCSRQRNVWMKHNKNKNELEKMKNEEPMAVSMTSENPIEISLLSAQVEQEKSADPWLDISSPNSLAFVASLHLGKLVDKSDRNIFDTEDKSVIIENFSRLMSYCANDVSITHEVYSHIFPQFRRLVPHPVSFSALRQIGTSILPTTQKWTKYLEKAEAIYQENLKVMEDRLHSLAGETERLKNDHSQIENDPWLSQLDWTIKAARFKKDGTPVARQAKFTGYPEWYRNLFKNADSDMKLTTRTRQSPLLLKLSWEGYPLFWFDKKGWCFKVPYNEEVIEELKEKNYVEVNHRAVLAEDLDKENYDEMMKYEQQLDYLEKHLTHENGTFVLFKVPHPDGPGSRTTNVLAKSFLKFFENGILSSVYEHAKDSLKLNAANSYWMGSRNRIMSQFVVYNDNNKREFGTKEKIGLILPQITSMGTVTRRAVEKTWLTASNAKKSRVGSELKSMIQAPTGYSFVGADVDSEELWIASLVGDSTFKIHGGTAIGWMTLEGTKNEGTDLHSKTANILGISRNAAKVFNYGRIYGAGVKFATQLLKQFNPTLSDSKALQTSQNLYAATKGEKGYISKKNDYSSRDRGNSKRSSSETVWFGGSESVVFNRLEKIAQQERPRTPVLGAGITSALRKQYLGNNGFLPSRINWAIQSSGVDYLHLLVVSMDYLIKKYNIEARLCITVHDEIRYMVKDKDKYKAALLLQISNLWTRAMFSEQLGITEVPQSCAFFSAVDIDTVLRKEVDMDCVTPSNPDPIPVGESLDIHQLLEKKISLGRGKPIDLSDILYNSRTPVLNVLDDSLSHESLKISIGMQIARDKKEFNKLKSSFLNYSSGDDYDQHNITRRADSTYRIPQERQPRKRRGGISEVEIQSKRLGQDEFIKIAGLSALPNPPRHPGYQTMRGNGKKFEERKNDQETSTRVGQRRSGQSTNPRELGLTRNYSLSATFDGTPKDTQSTPRVENTHVSSDELSEIFR